MHHPHHQSPPGLRWVLACSCLCRQVYRRYRHRSRMRLLCRPYRGQPGLSWPHKDSCLDCSDARLRQCPGCCRTDLQPGHCLGLSVG